MKNEIAKTVRGGCSGVAPKESHATASLFSNVAHLNFSVYFWHDYPEIIYDLPSKQQSAVTNKSSWTSHTSALNNLHQSKNVICGHFYYWISEYELKYRHFPTVSHNQVFIQTITRLLSIELVLLNVAACFMVLYFYDFTVWCLQLPLFAWYDSIW